MLIITIPERKIKPNQIDHTWVDWRMAAEQEYRLLYFIQSPKRVRLESMHLWHMHSWQPQHIGQSHHGKLNNGTVQRILLLDYTSIKYLAIHNFATQKELKRRL